MKPVGFAGANTVFAKDQPEYLPLPAYVDADDPYGRAITCWSMGWRERIKTLFTGRIYVQLLTFKQPLQPIKLTLDNPTVAA